MQANKKGFTLLQTLLVFIIVGCIAALIPTNVNKKVLLRYECEKVKEYLIQAQIKAIEEKKKVVITIKGSEINLDDKVIHLPNNTTCGSHVVRFNERGNVNMAQTIVCKNMDDEKSIIINLGSANVYVK